MKTFSIIIPVYNGHDVIGRALDSIYSQELSNEEFEVICIDDCSPTMETFDTLNNYTYCGVHPENIKVLRHSVNKRQGGARNTGVANASGEYILYLDADDYFVANSLGKLNSHIKQFANYDCYMFDYQQITPPNKQIKNSIYSKMDLPKGIVMSGEEFIQKYPVPWFPWLYAYKKDFLHKHNIQFVEHKRFEDTDYVIQSTLYANKIIFTPIEIVAHIVNNGSTTTVGNDVSKITDLFCLAERMRRIAEDYMQKNRDAALAAMHHHTFNYHSLLVRYLWRLQYKQIIKLLQTYPPYPESNDKLINFAYKHPKGYAILAQIARPILLSGIWLRNKLK